MAEGAALAKRLQRRQSLDAVEEFGAKRFERLLAALAAAALDMDEHGRGDQRDQRKHQHHCRYRHVPKGDKGKNGQRRQNRDRHLWDVLTEKGLQLLDPVDNRQHDPAGALAGKPRRPQFGDLVVKPAAQFLLNPDRGTMRDHRPVMLDQAAQNYGSGDADRRHSDRHKASARKDMRQQDAENCKARDAEDRGDEP